MRVHVCMNMKSIHQQCFDYFVLQIPSKSITLKSVPDSVPENAAPTPAPKCNFFPVHYAVPRSPKTTDSSREASISVQKKLLTKRRVEFKKIQEDADEGLRCEELSE